jgi:hypothetical protein
MRRVPRLAAYGILLFMPVLATCTASPQREVEGGVVSLSGSGDENRLVALLIDGSVD